MPTDELSSFLESAREKQEFTALLAAALQKEFKIAIGSAITLPNGETAPAGLVKDIITALTPEKNPTLIDKSNKEELEEQRKNPFTLFREMMGQALKQVTEQQPQEHELKGLEGLLEAETPEQQDELQLDLTEEQKQFGLFPDPVADKETGEAMQELMASVQARARFVLNQMADNPVAASNELDQLNNLMEGLKHVVGSARLSVYLHAVKQACEEKLPESLTLTGQVTPEQLIEIMDLKEQIDDIADLDPRSKRQVFLNKLKNTCPEKGDFIDDTRTNALEQIATAFFPTNQNQLTTDHISLAKEVRIGAEIAKLDKIGESLPGGKETTLEQKAKSYVRKNPADAFMTIGEETLKTVFDETLVETTKETVLSTLLSAAEITGSILG